MNYFRLLVLVFIFTASSFGSSAIYAFDPTTDDKPLEQPLILPAWFKSSFLDIREDITEATANKRGLIIYFGQSLCPYCKALLVNSWGRPDIVTYTRNNFDVIAIDVRGARTVTDFDNREYPEKIFSAKHRATFTPTLMFFDKSGSLALKLVGYRPPYQFRAALEYVADYHHRNENFRYYLARAEGAISYGREELNESDIFNTKSYNLKQISNKKPLVVFFEEPKCHACDVLHAGPLSNRKLISEFNQFHNVQLDMWSQTRVITPAGEEVSAKQWADSLGLSYAPTLIFFDENGKEIIRVESVIGFLRLNNVARYVSSRAYRKQPSFQLWRADELRKRTFKQ